VTRESREDFGAWVPGPRCRREATGRGRLDGMRLAVKDLIDVEGCVTGAGSPDWAASHSAAPVDAPAVAVLRSAGARVVGKTVTDELAFSLEGENAHHGTPRNPNAPGRLPGGSSSGSATAVASGQADIALGTDTGGSVRVPASFCGVWAMRPTHGRVPLQGVVPFAPSFDTVGWFARDAELLQAAGHVLLGTTASVAGAPLRLRVASDAQALAQPEVREALRDAAARLGISQTGHAFAGSWREWLEAYVTLQGLEIQRSLGDWILQRRPRFGRNIAPRFAAALALDRNAGEPWNAWRHDAAARLQQAIGPDEAWLVPAAPTTALPMDSNGEAREAFYAHALALGSLAGHAGLPQVVMPMARTRGLPVGVSLLSAGGNDERLLALARGVEAGMKETG
jgi:amidase